MLLVAGDQIRLATMEEAGAAETIAKDMAISADQTHYQDMTGAEPAPKRPQKPPQRPMLTALRDMPEAVNALQLRPSRRKRGRTWTSSLTSSSRTRPRLRQQTRDRPGQHQRYKRHLLP